MTGAWATPLLVVMLGAAFGVGVLLLVGRAPRMAAPSLAARIAPYIRDVADPQGLGPTVQGAARLRARARSLLMSVALLGSVESVTRRQEQAGDAPDAGRFRLFQVVIALSAGALGGVVAGILTAANGFAPPVVLLAPVGGIAAAAGWDALLTARARARSARIEEELPTVLDFLALCLAAGESMRDALGRVAASGTGILAAEIRRTLAAVQTGDALPDALTELGGRLHVPAVSRSLDHVIAAMERGAPLADVLRGQAQDAREDDKRALIEGAGRREILMLLPLVFLILPLSVVFAVFPGVLMLQLGLQ